MSRAAMDVRTLGRVPLLLVAGAGALSLVAVLYGHLAHGPDTTGHVLVACLEQLLPVAGGLACAGVLAGDDALELQATARPPVARLALVRIAAVVGLAGTCAALAAVLAAALGASPARGTAGDLALTFGAPALFLAGLAFAASVATRGTTPAAAAVVALAAAENIAAGPLSAAPLRPLFLFAGTYATGGWGTNRLTLTLAALALIALGAVAVDRPGTALDLVHGDTP